MAHTILEVEKTDASLGGPSESDNQTSLSTSSTSRLKKSFPNSPQHVNESAAPPGPFGKTLGRSDYREYYEEEVLGGNNGLYKALSLNGTAHSRNYVANGPPNLKNLSVEGEEPAPGTPGATIVKHGIGPNVNVGPAMGIVGWQVTQGVVELTPSDAVVEAGFSTPSSLPFTGDGSASPSATSLDISNSSLHAPLPGKSSAVG